MLATLTGYTQSLFNLFYPNVCLVCNNTMPGAQQTVCYTCVAGMPETGFWLDSDNRLMKRFAGRVNVHGAVALYRFTKGAGVQQLVHALKYYGRKDAGTFAGKLMGHKLLEPGSIIQQVDVVVPVPLHYKKLRKRGYNQCDYFAEGIAEVLGVPWLPDAVVRNSENISQTQMSRYDRWGNVAGIFEVQNTEALTGRHVLLVDDVMTTGATAEACLLAIAALPGTRVSFAAIAAAER